MKYLLTLLFTILCLGIVCAQPEVGNRIDTIRQLIRTEQLETALQVATAIFNDSTSNPGQITQAYFLQGICLTKKLRPREALHAFQAAAERLIRSDVTGKDTMLATLYFHIGDAYGEFDSSRVYLERSLEIRTRLFGAESPPVAFCLNSLGGLFAGKYRLGKSLEYRMHALDIFENHHLFHHAFAVANNLGMLYKSQGDHGRAMLYLEKAKNYSQSPGVSAPYRAIMLGNYAVLLADAKKEREAYAAIALAWAAQVEIGDSTAWLHISENHAEVLRLLDKSLEAIQIDSARLLRLILTRPDAHSMIAHIHGALANDFFLAGQAAKSLLHWDKAIAIYQSLLAAKQPTLANAYRAKAACFSALGDTVQASLFFHKSLLANGFDNHKVNDLIHWQIGFTTFWERAKLRFSSGDYENALADIQCADTCVMLQRLQLRVSKSNAQLSKLSRPAYELGAEIAGIRYSQTTDQRYFNLAFHFSEQSKSIQLAEALRSFEAVPTGDSVAQYLFEQEEFYRTEIARRDDSLAYSEGPNHTRLELEILDITLRYHALLDTIRAKYETYYNHKFGHRTILPEQQTAWCGTHDKAVAAWFLSQKSIQIFLFQKNNKPEWLRLPRNFALESAIQQMNDGMTAWFDDSLKTDARFDVAYKNYLSAAKLLYDQLLAPVMPLLQGHRLVVIPDAVLNYLSFDALLAEKPNNPYNFNELRFAAETLNISYGFSATLLSGELQKPGSQHPPGQVLAFAPFAYPDEGKKTRSGDHCLYMDAPLPLSAAQSEIAAYPQLRKRSFLRTESRRDSFIHFAPEAEYLHIATHGCASTQALESVFLLFSGPTRADAPEPFTIADVCKLHLRAKLAVLSACLSGQGPIVPGEGMLGMARAFAYAGVQRVIMTQWKVDDVASNELMQYFYPYLASGVQTDEALWLAKKKMFRQNRGFERLPYFWAGFVLIGAPE